MTTDSPELAAFKRQTWIVAQKTIHAHGEREGVEAILEELGVTAANLGPIMAEPVAEGMYRLEGGDPDMLFIKARSSAHEPEDCWFITKAHTPRATSYDPRSFSRIVEELIAEEFLNEANNYTVNLVKA